MDYLILVKLEFLVTVLLILFNRKVFWSEMKKVNASYIVGLSLFFFIIVIIFNANLNFFPSYHEWGALSAAKYLNSQTLFQEKEGFIYPTVLSPLFKIFGASPEVAVLLNLFLTGLCVLLVFFLAIIVLKNNLISFFSALIFVFGSLSVWYFFVKSGWPALTCFWLLCIEISLILFFKNPKNLSLGILGLLFILLAGQTREELFILIVLIPAGFLLYLRSIITECEKAPIAKLALSIFIFILIFLIFSAPIFAKNSQRKSQGGGTCGYWTSETKLLTGEISKSNLAIVNKIDNSIKTALNSRFSIYYILDDVSFLKEYLSSPFILFTLAFMLVGFVICLKRDLRMAILISSPIFLISAVYILDCTYYLSRYFAPLFGLAVVFIGGGVGFLVEKMNEYLNRKYLKSILLLIVFILFVSLNVGDLLKMRHLNSPWYYNFDGAEMTDYKEIKDACKELDKNQSFIIATLPSERDILSFLGHNVPQSLSGIISLDNLNFHQNKNKFYETFSLPVDESKNNYLLMQKNYFNPQNSQTELQELLDYVFKNYSLERVASNEVYDLYKFEL